jgi:hypothetical protein
VVHPGHVGEDRAGEISSESGEHLVTVGVNRDAVAAHPPARWRGHVSGAAVRVGVGTRMKYDGEVVVVEEIFGSAAGNELLVRDGQDRRFRLSLREALASGRAAVVDRTGAGGGR